MSLITIGNAIAAELDGINGLRIHRTPEEQVAEFPCSVISMQSMDLEFGPVGSAVNFARWAVDIVTSRSAGIASAIIEVEGFVELVQDALFADQTLNGTVDHIGGKESFIECKIITYEYAGVPVAGYRLTIPVKYKRNIPA